MTSTDDLNISNISFDREYWGISSDSDPVIYKMRLIMKSRRIFRDSTRVEMDHKFEILWASDDILISFDAFRTRYVTFDGTSRIFDTYDDAATALGWLEEKPGRALYNYDPGIST
jgi:hypothetical protein